MITAETIREALHQSHHWRDVLWRSVIADLEQRNPAAADAARQAIQTAQPYRIVGSATQRAVLAWPHLDAQSRYDWIWACQYVQRAWLRGYLTAHEGDEEQQGASEI
jgi:hypothetical protein